jgi:flagella basal body P-ring formation protein FlgA
MRLVLSFLLLTATLSAASAAPVPAPLAREELLALVSRDLAAHFRLEGDLQLELTRPWSAPDAVASQWTLEGLEYPLQPSAAMLVRCRLSADGQAVDELTLIVRASLWRNVWVTRQPLEVGAAFDPSVLDTRRIDVLREREYVPTVSGDRSYVFARSIPAGRVLTWHDLNHRPLVRKGQLVEVSAVDGLLCVTMKALALENGAQGDTVTVRNPESHKDFSALVVDENHVQVHF